MRLVLASTSRYRRELIGRLGLEVELCAPAYDEQAEKAALGPLPAVELAPALARGKALSLAERCPDALIIGADQIAELEGVQLEKPGTPERAREQLARLAGREHRLLTAVCVHEPRSGRLEEALDEHRLRMRALTPPQIAAYVDRDRPLDCAGSYRVESLGIALFEHVRGDDYTAVVGLPLTRLAALLARFGVDVLAPPA